MEIDARESEKSLSFCCLKIDNVFCVSRLTREGSGGMFVQSEKFLEAHGAKRGAVSVYGQEANPDTWKMAKMNMAIRGIDADFGPYNADTFSNDLHPTLIHPCKSTIQLSSMGTTSFTG